MPVYEITSFRGGISDYEDRGIEGSFKFGSGLNIRKRIDSLTCQQALTDETGTFSDLVRWFVVATDGNTYGFGSTGKIYKRDSEMEWSLVYTDSDGAIKGAYEWPEDDGKSYLVWATDTKLKAKELPGASNWSDVNARSGYPKTDLTSADWHTMRDSGGDLIIANKSTLAALGYDGSYSISVLDLVPGNVAKTLVERNARTIVGTYKPANPNQGVNGAIEAEVPLAQVGDDGEIFFADMNDTIPATRFPGGGYVNPGGVDIDVEPVDFFEWTQAASSDPDVNSWLNRKSVGGMSLWGVYSADTDKGGIYSYGRKRKNHPFVLNLEYALDADEIGAVKKVGSDVLVSYKSGSSYGVKRIDTTTKATGIYEGLDFKAPIKRPINITGWDYVEIYMDELPVGCSVEFWYRINKDGSFVQATQEDGTNVFNTTSGQKAVFQVAEEGNIFEPRVVLNPSGNLTPEVYRIRTYFK